MEMILKILKPSLNDTERTKLDIKLPTILDTRINKTTAAVCISRRALKGKKYLFRDIHNDFIGQGHYSKGNGQIKVRP